MLELVKPKTNAALDRAAWHKPKISIVVTHRNYSDHVEDALRSIVDQTHENWECIVVDDASDDGHRLALEKIVASIGCDRIRIVWLGENIGQIPSFFVGLDAMTGEFCCLLDPDDRYAETFLEDMLAVHLNGWAFCPVACSDQYLLKNGEVISGTNRNRNCKPDLPRQHGGEIVTEQPPQLLHFSPWAEGWFGTSTSSMMFRRSALAYMRPARKLGYMGSADSFLAKGAHLMGGTLFLTEPLVYRTVHDHNAYLRERVFTSHQDKGRYREDEIGPSRLADVTETIIHNGGAEFLHRSKGKVKRRSLATRLRRSFIKRWRKLV